MSRPRRGQWSMKYISEGNSVPDVSCTTSFRCSIVEMKMLNTYPGSSIPVHWLCILSRTLFMYNVFVHSLCIHIHLYVHSLPTLSIYILSCTLSLSTVSYTVFVHRYNHNHLYIVSFIHYQILVYQSLHVHHNHVHLGHSCTKQLVHPN